jgi:tetratricopeptide (TPR) repeat protein
MPSLSLCMIARDEERFLAGALASVRGIADEIVVVDTGSADRTREIAAAAGARVLRFDWIDDFAAARNHGLEAARGTHVLVLDADERLGAGAAQALARACADRALTIGMLPLHDADALDAPLAEVVSGARRLYETAWVPRFFKNHPRLRYRRRVHETLFEDVDRALAEAGGGIGPVEAPIVHFGEVPELRRERSKSARNTRLLEQALAERPDDGDLAGYLALEYARAGETERARELAERHLPPFLAALDRLPAGARKPSPIQLASVLATCALERGDASAALEAVRSAAARCPEPHPNLLFLEGAALEAQGELEAALGCYERCLALDGRRFTIPVHPGATREAPRVRIANVLLAAGHATDALAVLEGVAGRLAQAADLCRAEALLACGEPARALALLAPFLARPDPPPDLFALASWASALLGEENPSFVEAARRAPDARWFERRRRAAVEPPDAGV